MHRHLDLLKTWLPIGLIVVGILGITRVRMDVDILELLPQQMKEVQGLSAFLEHFSRRDEMIITVEGDDPEVVESAHRDLAEHFASQTDTLGIPTSRPAWDDEDPDGPGELMAWLLLNAPPESFTDWTSHLSLDQRDLVLEDSLDVIGNSMDFGEALTLTYDPYGLCQGIFQGEAGMQMDTGGSEFGSEDGHFRVIYLTAPEGGTATYKTTIAWVNLIKETVARGGYRDRGVAIGFTAEPVFAAEISASMERDMKVSGFAAMLLTAGIFGWRYRRLKPLLALMGCLGLTFLLTLGLAGWSSKSMTVMSVGFAAILIGLSVDYGVIIYQSSLTNKDATASQLRRWTRTSILWAALTTAAAFGSLGLSVMPGIASLGQLVALGIMAGALVMLYLYPGRVAQQQQTNDQLGKPSRLFEPTLVRRLSWVVGFILLVLIAILPFRGLPALDTSTGTLRPRNSQAYGTMDRLQANLLGGETASTGIVSIGDTDRQQQFDQWQATLQSLKDEGLISSWNFPAMLLPSPKRQQENLRSLSDAHLNIEALTQAADTAGFEPSAMALTTSILTHWRHWRTLDQVPVPSLPMGKRLLERLTASPTPAENLMLLTFNPTSGNADTVWERVTQQPQFLPVSWERISHQLNTIVPPDMMKVLATLSVFVLLMLIITFRSLYELALCLGTVVVSMLALCGAMAWLGWQWNFFSLGALLLSLGAGLDYSIHILIDLKRHHYQWPAIQRGILPALCVCALSTVAGFGSIGWADNLGLASLGQVCALALTLNAMIALFLLPSIAVRWAPVTRHTVS